MTETGTSRDEDVGCKRLIWEGPTRSVVGVSEMHSWTSACGRFKVHVLRGARDGPIYQTSYKTDEGFWWSDKEPSAPGNYARKYDSLAGAFRAARDRAARDRAARVDGGVFDDNSAAMIARAAETGLLAAPPTGKRPGASPGRDDTTEATMTDDVIEFDREDVTRLALECQFHTYPKKTNAELGRLLMAWYKDEDIIEAQTDWGKEMLERVVAAGRLASVDSAAPRISVVGDEPAGLKADKAAKSKKIRQVKSGTKKSSDTGSITKVKAVVPTRKAREKKSLGDANAKVKACLTKTPKTFMQIVEETGLTRGQVRYKFLDGLVEEGYAVKIGHGWAKK